MGPSFEGLRCSRGSTPIVLEGFYCLLKCQADRNVKRDIRWRINVRWDLKKVMGTRQEEGKMLFRSMLE